MKNLAEVKCVYGLPDQKTLLMLNQWLSEKGGRTLIVIEDSPENLFDHFGNFKVYFTGQNNEEEVLKQIAWDHVFLAVEFMEMPGNATKSLTRMREIFQKCAHIQLGVHLTASDYRERGLNILKNLPDSCDLAKQGKSLFGAFKNIPALICGGGPSLEKGIEAVKTAGSKALIFSGGAALNVLGHHGIKPHFSAGIDPDPSYSRFLSQSAFETAFFYQSRFNRDQLKYSQGPRLWIEGSGGYPIEEWLFSSQPFDGGWNVATFLTRLAYELGCNPIILCGVDLASPSKHLYADSVEKNPFEPVIEVKDEEGALFYSKNDWIMAARWLSDFAAARNDVDWINASDGLKLKGFTQGSVTSLKFAPQQDLDGRVHAKVQSAPNLFVDPKQFEVLENSFEKAGTVCEKLIRVMEKIFPAPPETKGEYVLLEVELEDEIAYQKFLLPVWEVWKYVFQREAEEDAYGIPLHRWLFMKRICDEAKQIRN